MHERAGDRILKPGKARRIGKQALAVSSSDSAPPRSPPPPSYQPSIVNHNTVPTEQIPEAAAVPNKIGTSMTRRFTVSEKLQIIDKFKELENISATCRCNEEVSPQHFRTEVFIINVIKRARPQESFWYKEDTENGSTKNRRVS